MLEDGIRVLIYAGDVDFICNWMGNKAWTQALNWSGKTDFNAAQDYNWEYGSDKTIGGKIRQADAATGNGGLTFMQVWDCRSALISPWNASTPLRTHIYTNANTIK
jgi:cathepsin A (carboxypeptidase C)